MIGAFVGAAIWRLADLAGAPGIPEGPGVFVVVAMMACFGSVAHAPLAVMIMVAEMTGSFSVVPGAMIAVGIAYLLLITRTDVSIYQASDSTAKPPRPNADSAAPADQQPRSTSVGRRTTKDVNSRNTISEVVTPACYFTGAFFFAARAAPFSVVAPRLDS